MGREMRYLRPGSVELVRYSLKVRTDDMFSTVDLEAIFYTPFGM